MNGFIDVLHSSDVLKKTNNQYKRDKNGQNLFGSPLLRTVAVFTGSVRLYLWVARQTVVTFWSENWDNSRVHRTDRSRWLVVGLKMKIFWIIWLHSNTRVANRKTARNPRSQWKPNVWIKLLRVELGKCSVGVWRRRNRRWVWANEKNTGLLLLTDGVRRRRRARRCKVQQQKGKNLY